jgi:hypothetical protein
MLGKTLSAGKSVREVNVYVQTPKSVIEQDKMEKYFYQEGGYHASFS